MQRLGTQVRVPREPGCASNLQQHSHKVNTRSITDRHEDPQLIPTEARRFHNDSSPAVTGSFYYFTQGKQATHGWALGEPGFALASASAATASSPPSTSFMMRCATLTSTCSRAVASGVQGS